MYQNNNSNEKNFKFAILNHDYANIIEYANLLGSEDYYIYYKLYAQYELYNEVKPFYAFLQTSLKCNENQKKEIYFHLSNLNISDEILQTFIQNNGLQVNTNDIENFNEEDLANILFPLAIMKQEQPLKKSKLMAMIFICLGVILSIIFFFVSKRFSIEVRYFYTVFLYIIPTIMISLSTTHLLKIKNLFLNFLIVFVFLYFLTLLALIDLQKGNFLITHLSKTITSGFDYVRYLVEKMNGTVIEW